MSMARPVRPEPPDEAGPGSFIEVFRRHAAGVAVITVGGERPTGMTATSLASVSADPPLLSFNVSLSSSSWPAVKVAEHLGVHVLAADQGDLAIVFATRGIDRFAAVGEWTVDAYGVPRLPGVVAAMTVRPHTVVEAGDHAVVVAEVLAADYTDRPPLVWHRGGYTGLVDR